MKTLRICLGCGTPLPPDAPGGLCPQCLLKSDPAAPTQTIPAAQEMRRAVPVPGDVFGSYRILRLLGQGGMGEVYEAEHVTDGRRVALKVMSHELGTEQDRKRFLREGRLAASVNHPNVVYVFGSEEIDGIPVISMELVAGGTLRDRLKSEKYLSITEAVEAAIQVVDGLEAASTAGVLHRDIKPANCFVDPDGAVKVGDFGLSVSTLARGESLLTAKGSVLGTPAYASPEQLRGEELDVRSDIYSVGATLYHLLTGETPFAAHDFVKLITEVLDKAPASPQAHRSEIPAELSRVVLRCLAKDRKERFQSYAELRNALLPFRATEVAPANPARRFLAGLIDEMIAFGPCILFSVYWSTDPLGYLTRERTFGAALVWLGFYGVYAAYYAIAEGLFGAAIGKTLCGLRVVGPDRQLPGIPRALLRVAIYMSTFVLPSLLLITVAAISDFRPELVRTGESITEWLWLPLWLGLFVTMRRRNGYAALHDILSRTRVIIRPRSEPRPALESAAPAEAPPFAGVFGPYVARRILWQSGAERLLVGTDPTLQRNVWIHVRPEAEPAIAGPRRELSRPARLRWLTGGVAEGSRWEAYDALSGQPLVETPRRSWSAVRFWLLDLAEELAAGVREPNTAAPFALDRIWISSSGRALLLDFPASASPHEARLVEDVPEMQRALSQVLECTMGTEPSSPQTPLHAQSFLQNLRNATFEKAEFIIGNLRSLITKPATITRPGRVASLTLLPALMLLLTVFLAGIITFERIRWERAWAAAYPDQPSIYTATHLYELTRDQRDEGRATPRDVKLVRVYIAQQFGAVITNETFWSDPKFGLIFLGSERRTLKEIVADYSSANPKDIEEANRVVPPRLAEQERLERLTPIWILTGCSVVYLFCFALVGLVAAVGFRAVPSLRLFGIAVVDRRGKAASRLRLLVRWACVWLPSGVLLVGVAALVAIVAALGTQYDEVPVKYHSALRTLTMWLIPLALLIWGSFIGYAVLHPARGLQDRIAGTWLVPR